MTTELFERLDEWVATVDVVEFAGDDGRQSTDAATLVTTFVLVQTLGSYGVVDADWLRETWETHERTYGRDEKRAVLDAFLADVDALFESQGETGLLGRHVTTDVDLSETNVEALYRALETVLGIETRTNGTNPGVTDYDFTQFDEDVFGHIYERHLAEGRSDNGIYYTPRYVSDAVVADTVTPQLRRLSTRITAAVVEESWGDAEAAVREFTDFTVLDPACGTGSFLVAAYATIREEYGRLFDVLDAERQSKMEASGSEGDSAIERLESLLQSLGYTEDDDGSLHLREQTLAATLVVRHLYAVDVDAHALEVAKLNLWLEAVECDTHVCDDTPMADSCVTPALDLNFGRGDALVGLSDERVESRLRDQYESEMRAVRHARDQFLDAPDDPAPLGRATASLAAIRPALDSAFEEMLDASGLPTAIVDETTPFYWPLQFWHVLAEGDGFDCVVGNPPWVTEPAEPIKQFLAERYDHQAGQPDLYRYFLERSVTVTAGRLGMVTPNTWLSIPGAQQLRRLVFRTARLETIAFVPEAAFTGVGQNSLVVVVDRTAQDAGADAETAPIPVGEIADTGTVRRIRNIRPADIGPPTYHVNPYVGTEERSIVATMDADATALREVADLTVGYQLYHRSLHATGQIENEAFHSETKAGPDYVADTRSDALRRYHLDRSKNRYVDASADFFRIPPRRFLDGEKLLLREVPSKTERGLIATRSEDTLLFPKSVISVVLTDDDYDYEHLLGLLNSRLVYLASLVTGEKMGQDLFPRVSLAQLRELPLEGTTHLTPLVTRMEHLAAIRRRFYRCWTRHTETATESRSLGAILDGDEGHRTDGETWTVASAVAPNGDVDAHSGVDPLEREFESFAFDGGTDDPTLVVFGIDGGVEYELLDVEFRNRETLQMVYLSLVALFESRARVDHLKHVVEKTSVPVGGRGAESRDGADYAVDTMRDVQCAFDSGVERTNTPDPEIRDIVKIDDAVVTAQSTLDAAVFDLYGLSVSEAKTVLSVLDIRESVVSRTVAKLAARREGDEET